VSEQKPFVKIKKAFRRTLKRKKPIKRSFYVKYQQGLRSRKRRTIQGFHAEHFGSR
jgi:hypothetical protein